MLSRFGRPSMVYLDNGSGFISKDVRKVYANLDIGLVHGSAGYPEGRGKIERFHRTLYEHLLRHWQEAAAIDTDAASLELRLREYLIKDYNQTEHSAINAKPDDLFDQDPKPLGFYENIERLREGFILPEKRKVSRDNVISFQGSTSKCQRAMLASRSLS